MRQSYTKLYKVIQNYTKLYKVIMIYSYIIIIDAKQPCVIGLLYMNT